MASLNTPKPPPHFTTPKGPATTDAVMSALWERVSINLNQEELAWFSAASEEASCMSANLKQVVDGIAALVVDGEQIQPFQGKHDVAQLLFFIGQSLSGIDAMHAVGSEAEHKMA